MDLKTYEFQSEFARRYLAEGKSQGLAEGKSQGLAEGEARGILRVLETRGIAVPDDVRELILGCRDLARLDAWLVRALTAETAADVVRET